MPYPLTISNWESVQASLTELQSSTYSIINCLIKYGTHCCPILDLWKYPEPEIIIKYINTCKLLIQ